MKLHKIVSVLAKHPIPWKVEIISWCGARFYEGIIDSRGAIVVEPHGLMPEPSIRTAAFICEVVNNYDFRK